MTPEERAHWLAARAGCLTASHMCDAMAFRKDGKPAAERTKLLHDLLAERVTGHSVRHYVSPAMEHGIQFEDEAKEFYELTTGAILMPAPYIPHPRIEHFGATPDALLDEGLAEFKCPTSAKFIAWTLAGVVPEEHRPQMAAQMLCTGRPWCEFVAYDPRIRDRKRRLFLRRFEPTDEELRKVEDAAVAFLAELDGMFESFTSGAAA